MTNEGVSGSDAGLALATQGIGSALVLNAILWLAVIVSIPLTGFNPIYATAAIVGALLLAAFAGMVLLLTRGEERAAITVRAVVSRLPYLKRGTGATADRVVHQIAARTRVLAADSALLRRAVLWAAANWLLD
ncbi:integral membrane protein-like protein, partial [mine drainage metagenome]